MNKRTFLLLLTLCAVIACWFIVQILPTFDDWNTLSLPNWDRDWMPYFLPYGAVWRPGDALFGYINGLDYRLYPTLNHIVVVAGHLCNCFLVYSIGSRLSFSDAAKKVATLFFFLCPCVLGTVLSVDGLNQTYSQLWGLAAVLAYLTFEGKSKYLLWALFTLLSAWSKDNGIAWAVVPPMLAYAFDKTDRRTLIRHFLIGIAFAVAYGAIRMSLPKTIIYNPDYYEFSLMKHLKGIAIWLGFTWVPADYVAIFGHRNLMVAIPTLLVGVPFIIALFLNNAITGKPFWGLVACAIVTISPNLLISLTVMNAYASLGMAALIVGLLYQQSTFKRWMRPLFAAYLLSAVFIDVHHYIAAYESSLVGKRMAVSTVEQSTVKADSVRVIILEDEYRKFSNFCVPPSEAFGWGLAVRHETAYQWPGFIKDTTISRSAAQSVAPLTHQALRSGYSAVWVVDNKNVKVIER